MKRCVPYGLFREFPQFMEMVYDILEVHTAVYVETVPYVATYHSTSESQVAYLLYIFQTDSCLCHDAFVYKAFATGFAKLIVSVMRGIPTV